jgi:hypothetical protein
MELAGDSRQIAQYSPTSTPILDALRPLSSRRRDRVSAGEYFFLSSAFIVALISMPWLRQVAVSMSSLRLPVALALILVIIPGAGLGVAVAVHETGHLLGAWLAGFRVARRSDSAMVQLYSCSALRIGPVALEPGEMDHLPRRLMLLILGGPAISLLVPLVVEISLRTAGMDVLAAFFIHGFSGCSILLGLAELIPDSGKANFSDGARILMLLKNDRAGQRWIYILEQQRALARGESPRNWDETALTHAAAIDDDTRDAVQARWIGYLWATERQDITAATKYLEEALAAPASASAPLRDRLFLEAAMFQAWFRGDSRRARFWTARMRPRKLSRLLQLRLDIALIWSDGKLFDAWEKLGDYFYLLRELPALPARDLLEHSAVEWKRQMESRMLTRAWRSLYSISQEVEHAALENDAAGAKAAST